MAANRGYKLVKSRGRVPGRPNYGKYGLKDAETGRETFGFGKHRVMASFEQVEEFFRNAGVDGWQASLKAAKKRQS